jgi:tryptophan synthase beta chain
MPALTDLEMAHQSALEDPDFQEALSGLLACYCGRPTPLYFAERLSGALSPSARVYLKREDLNHTGAHKINNALGQALLAKRMHKSRVVAETGAGQHGVAMATACALLELECTVYMGALDVERQRANVDRMHLLGATVTPVHSGAATLKDATNEAIRDWVTHVGSTHYAIGSTVGPHPYPSLVRDFQRVIGEETKEQIQKMEGRQPHALVACVGGGSNAMGLFAPFLKDKGVRLYGVEAGGSRAGHAAALTRGKPGILHGAYAHLLQDEDGQVVLPHSISAGLDYPGVGPEHSALKDSGRVHYESVTDQEALAAFVQLCRLEGVIPALESSHALAFAKKLLSRPHDDDLVVVVNLSGRGDKDIHTVMERQSEGTIHAD